MRRYVAYALALAVVGIAAFTLTRQIAPDDNDTEATGPTTPRIDPDQLVATIDAERAKPRFVGEIDGIFIAPRHTDWPFDRQREREILIAGGCVAAPADHAGELDLAKEPALPAFTRTAPEPEVVQCSGVTTGVNWEYHGTSSGGTPATLLITRSVSRAWDLDVAAESVSKTVIGGRDAILIKPATPDGTGQTSQVVFPEPFGSTLVHAFSLSEAELLTVGEAVAAATNSR